MKSNNLLSSIVAFRWFHLAMIVVVTTVCSGVVSADDWPRWMGPKYDGVWRETGMIDKFPEAGPSVLWRQKIGAGYGGPSVAGGKIFIMERTKDEAAEANPDAGKRGARVVPGGERVICLDMKTGNELWSHQYDCPYSIAYGNGPRCTPTVDGDLVYSLGAMGRLICFRADSGDVVWEKELTKEYDTKPSLWGFASHPYVDGEKLIVPVGGKGDGKGPGTGLVAFDKKTGNEIWRAVTTHDIGYAPVVIYEPAESGGSRQLIFWHAAGITSLNPEDGTEYWFTKFPEEPNQSVVTIATPVLIGNQLLISEFYKGSMLLELGSNPPSIKEVWRNFKLNPKLDDAMNCMLATPVVSDGFAYGVAYSRRGEGVLRCIDLKTAEAKWTDEKWLADKPLMFASAFITPNEDKYFIFDDLGELIIAKLDSEGWKEMDRAKLLEPTTASQGRDVVWSHPAYSDGKMIVRNDKEIICVDLKKSNSK